MNEQIQKISQEIENRIRPFEKAIEALDGIPGISRTNAEQILCDTGIDMSRFPTDKHFASWAALCPGNNETGDKRKSGKTRKGNMALKAALTQARFPLQEQKAHISTPCTTASRPEGERIKQSLRWSTLSLW